MNSRLPRWLSTLIALLLCMTSSEAALPNAPVTIDLTLTESSHVDRIHDPVTTGVPIPLTATQSTWALFDGTTEVPLQTTLLPNMTTPWLLLDFATSVAANATKTLTLKEQPPTAVVTDPVTIAESNGTVTVTTGKLQTQLSTTDFNLLDSVWLDRNGDRVFDETERVTAPSGTPNLTITEAGSGTVYSGRGTPTAVAWEYRGPLRATLRVDGVYTDGVTEPLQYTTRLTWHAGQSFISIEHLIRNSSLTDERYVKLTSALLAFGTTQRTDRVARSGSTVWANIGANGFAIELIPATLNVSTVYDPSTLPPGPRHNETIDVDANAGMIVPDLSYHGASVILDYSDSLSASEQTRRSAATVDPLMALAPPQWYSDQGAFGLEHCSTYDDEKNAYRKWGWTWPTPGDPRSYEHSLPRAPTLYPTWSVLDATMDPESDDLWMNIVMYARVQQPFYLDRLRAWARYWKWEWAFRTDNFPYDGAWNNFWDGPSPTRIVVEPTPPTLTTIDQEYISNNIKTGKASPGFMWNGGALDYYYLTGDRDAYQAAIDIAEQCRAFFAWQALPNGGAGGDVRFPSRCLLVLTRTWEATGEAQWKTAADHLLTLFLDSPRYDQRGFYFKAVSEMGASFTCRFPGNAKQVTPFMMATAVEALYRYYVLTGDERVRTQLVAIGTFGRDHGIDPSFHYGGDEIVVDSPTAGTVRHLSYSQFYGTQPIVPYAAANSTEHFINGMVIAYRLTGDRSFVYEAKYAWNQASKRDYQRPYTEQLATDLQVGRFVNSLQPSGSGSLLFPCSGDLTAVSLLFHDAVVLDDTAPSTIQNLRVR